MVAVQSGWIMQILCRSRPQATCGTDTGVRGRGGTGEGTAIFWKGEIWRHQDPISDIFLCH